VRLLLDTCTFLWIILDSPELSPGARELFSDQGNEVFLSVASTWEIIVKHRLGRLPLPGQPHLFLPRQRRQHGVHSLPIEEEAVLQLTRLPDYHRDPFDRILICQAIAHGLVLLTPDSAVTQYPVRTAW
jgi:PIN domain nuclease of toxin-antitoxin system